MSHSAVFRKILLGFLCAWIVACTIGPDYIAPQPEIVANWETAQGIEPQDNADLSSWWRVFGDAQLSNLMQRALSGNLTLKQAWQRVLAARAQLGISSAELYPRLDANAAISRQRASINGSFAHDNNFTEQTVGLDLSWELDIFGRLRRERDAARAFAEASEFDERGVRVALLAELASDYIALRTVQQRQAVAKRNIVFQERVLALTQKRFKRSLVSELDVAQARQVLVETKIALPELEFAVSSKLNSLALLLGELPGALNRELEIVESIPAPPKSALISFPANLLRQRPDILRAERNLAAQTALIGVSESLLYPNFNMFGAIGFDSLEFKHLMDSDSLVYSIGRGLKWNVFDFGRIRNLIKAQEARCVEALANYQQSVLTAFSDAQTALVAYRLAYDKLEAARSAQEAAARTNLLAEQQYRAGKVQFQNVLDSERSLFRFEDQLVQAEGQVSTSLVQLYKALGGGWGKPEADAEILSTKQ